jgi:basic amino acid/polyamine antiporter, APA family
MATSGSRSPVEFVRALTRVDATALVAGSMIGSGVYIVSADIARQVGSPGMLMLVWLIAGGDHGDRRPHLQ